MERASLPFVTRGLKVSHVLKQGFRKSPYKPVPVRPHVISVVCLRNLVPLRVTLSVPLS